MSSRNKPYSVRIRSTGIYLPEGIVDNPSVVERVQANTSEADWLTLERYMAEVRETRTTLEEEPATGRDLELLDALLEHGERLAARYPVS